MRTRADLASAWDKTPSGRSVEGDGCWWRMISTGAICTRKVDGEELVMRKEIDPTAKQIPKCTASIGL